MTTDNDDGKSNVMGVGHPGSSHALVGGSAHCRDVGGGEHAGCLPGSQTAKHRQLEANTSPIPLSTSARPERSTCHPMRQALAIDLVMIQRGRWLVPGLEMDGG